MASLDLPKLRPLGGHTLTRGGRAYLRFEDSLGLAMPKEVPVELFRSVIRRFDGRTPLDEIQDRMLRDTGRMLKRAQLEAIVRELDEAMILDGPTFAAYSARYRDEHVRPASHAGRSYAGTERALRAQIGSYFSHPEAAGRPSGRGGPSPDAGRLRGVLSPHIDFARGGVTYTWAYRELVERSDADLFVILGVAHQYCRHRFALTRKDFETPLGLARTDRDFVDRLADLAGAHLFEDELAHRTEHSVEFQVVFLQYLLGDSRDFSVVPILVGSFQDLLSPGSDPIDDPEVRRFVEALRAAERAAGRRACFIGGIDLAHVGPEFGDRAPLDAPAMDEVRRFDAEMIDRATAMDPRGWFRTAADLDNRYRVCGLAATYTLLHAVGPARGRLLRYDQAVNPGRTGGVTFCSVAFEATDEHAHDT